MMNLLDLAMLICASFGAMAFGIFSAFLLLRMCFALMRPAQRPAPVKQQPEAARVG
ncbi:MAG: hypothetical protein WBA18_11000 [Terracidiphilus sp.]